MWVGRKSSGRVRTTAWLLGRGLHNRLGMPYYAPVIRVTEGREPELFLKTLGKGVITDDDAAAEIAARKKARSGHVNPLSVQKVPWYKQEGEGLAIRAGPGEFTIVSYGIVIV